MVNEIAGREIKNNLTVADMIQNDFSLTDFFDADEYPIDLNWIKVLKLCNSAIVKGEPVTKQSKVSDVVRIFQEVMTQSFL